MMMASSLFIRGRAVYFCQEGRSIHPSKFGKQFALTGRSFFCKYCSNCLQSFFNAPIWFQFLNLCLQVIPFPYPFYLGRYYHPILVINIKSISVKALDLSFTTRINETTWFWFRQQWQDDSQKFSLDISFALATTAYLTYFYIIFSSQLQAFLLEALSQFGQMPQKKIVIFTIFLRFSVAFQLWFVFPNRGYR